jgi:hypothetical protein
MKRLLILRIMMTLQFGLCVLTGRATKPCRRAVEGAVEIVYSRIYAPLRKKVYSSLG